MCAGRLYFHIPSIRPIFQCRAKPLEVSFCLMENVALLNLFDHLLNLGDMEIIAEESGGLPPMMPLKYLFAGTTNLATCLTWRSWVVGPVSVQCSSMML